MPFFANSKKQDLAKHSFAVAYIAHQMTLKLIKSDNANLAKCSFYGGAFHDCGKAEPGYMKWVSEKIKNKKKYPEDYIDTEFTQGSHIDNIQNFSFEKYPRHNEISTFLFGLNESQIFFNGRDKLLNGTNINLIKHLIYWHHEKPIRDKEFIGISSIHNKLEAQNVINEKTIVNQILENFKTFVNEFNSVATEYNFKIIWGENISNVNCIASVDHIHLEINKNNNDFLNSSFPQYKIYKEDNNQLNLYKNEINENMEKSLLRAILISADRHVSGLNEEQLNNHIKNKTLDSLVDNIINNNNDNDLKDQINHCLLQFNKRVQNSERNKQQTTAAQEVFKVADAVVVLKGPAGCGKTKIALECAALSGASKILWICPRVQVCESIFQELISQDYLPNASIEICTGSHKEISQNGQIREIFVGEEFSGQIVITTIDQIVKSIITHTNVTSLIQYMLSYVVFDEYHEYTNMDAFNLLFAELIYCKQTGLIGSKALLISATPNYVFLNDVLNIECKNIININSFNKKKYEIKCNVYDETSGLNPLFEPIIQEENEIENKKKIVISNTATAAQLSYIKNPDEKSLLFHSKFLLNDKIKILENIYGSFGESVSKNHSSKITSYNILRSGPIIQASMNISCEWMMSEFTTAENLLQRLGRLGRFAEYDLSTFNLLIPLTIHNGAKTSSCATLLNKSNCLDSAMAWYQFLKTAIELKAEKGEFDFTIDELYAIFDSFYKDESSKVSVSSDILKSLKQSSKLLNFKIHDPVMRSPKMKKNTDGKMRLKYSSLRGNSRFVQMTYCDVINQKGVKSYEIIDDYVCNENNYLTLDTDILWRNNNHNDKVVGKSSLLNFMQVKHHMIRGGKKAYDMKLLSNRSVNQDLPVYTSYAPSELKATNNNQYEFAIVYARRNGDPVGMISLPNISSSLEIADCF